MRYYVFLAGVGLAFLLLGCSAPERRQNFASEPVLGSSLVWSPENGYERVDERPVNEPRRAALRDFVLLHDSFAHGSEVNLGKPADEAAVTDALLAYIQGHERCLLSAHRHIWIRWLSSTAVVAMVTYTHFGSVYYCVVLNKEAKWETRPSLPKEYIPLPQNRPRQDSSIAEFPR
jgi:hypothetical protein